MSHTPGPWRAEWSGLGEYDQQTWDVKSISVGSYVTGWGSVRQWRDDANLIAAAPNLLEACKTACNVLAAINLREPEWLGVPMAILKLQAAIAKAEGESNA